MTAERQFLAALGGGCSVPVAAYAEVSESLPRKIHLRTLVISPDGVFAIRLEGSGSSAVQLGNRLARQALNMGAGRILEEVSHA